MIFGTLLSDATQATAEYAAGVRVMELELGWDQIEPTDGSFNASYLTTARTHLDTMRAAGMQVVLGWGGQYPPAWLFSYTNSRYLNQFSRNPQGGGAVNFAFNQYMRHRAELMIDQVLSALDPANIWAVRIGMDESAELLYPDMNDGTQTNSYWAYDGMAQGGAGRPPGVPACPFPGWLPGQTTYLSNPFTTAQVQDWYAWYLAALVDTANWQTDVWTQRGVANNLQLLMPGQGVRPLDYATAIANYLNGTGDSNHTMGRGAVWDQVISGLRNTSAVTAYCSSLADGSGGNDLPQPGDALVGLSDSQISGWSAARWLAANAARADLPFAGEQPGGVMADVAPGIAQVKAANGPLFMLAHDADLTTLGSGMTLAQYAALIAENPLVFGQPDIIIRVDSTDGGSLVNITQYVMEINGVDVEMLLQASDSFGKSWVAQVFPGVRKVNDITLKGFYDDTASTGPDAIFGGNTQAVTRTFEIAYGATKTTTVEVWFKNYRRLPKRREKTGYEVVLAPSGAVIEA